MTIPRPKQGVWMERTERTELLARLPEETVFRLAEELAGPSFGAIEVVTQPTVGMIMARVIDGAQGEQFNLGEVLVTEARVSLAGHEGWAMVMGAATDRALAVAIVDAALEAGHTRRPEVERDLAAFAAEQEAVERVERIRLEATMVDFETF